MALPEDLNKIYGSTATGGLTPISDVNYAKGWEFVGSNPPTKNDFSYLQNLSDLKSQWLYSNKLQRTDPFGDIKSDGAAAVSAALANIGLLGGLGAKVCGRLIGYKVYTSSSTYTPTDGVKKVRIRCLGGGGGGGGAEATNSGFFAAGTGGNAGSYAETPVIDPPSSGAVITIGSGGNGGPAGANPGSNGGASSVGSLVNSPGGTGGGGGAQNAFSNTIILTSSPTPAATGTLAFSSRGAPASPVIAFSSGLIRGGDGGASFLGCGGAGGHSVSSINGAAAVNYGAGGGGSAMGQSGFAIAGAAGMGGIVIIEEYA